MERIGRWCSLVLCGVLCLLVVPVRAVPDVLAVAVYEEAPYQFLNDEGEITGLLVELFDAVAQRAEYRIQYECYDSLRKCVDALSRGEVDLILGMPSATNYALAETAELYASALVIAGNTSYVNRHDLEDDAYYYTAGYSHHGTEREIIYTMGADRYIVSDRTHGLIELLAEKKLDVAILDRAVLDYAVENEYPELDINITNSYLDTVKYTVACAPGDSSLLRALNTAILDLRIGGNYNEIRTRWIQEDVETDWKTVLIYVAVVATLLLTAFGIYYIINRRIKRLLEHELEKKTQDIRCANAQLESQIQQLQFEGELRNRLIKTARNGMVIVDREGRVQLMNRSANRMAGFPARSEGALLAELPCFCDVLAQVEGDIFAPGFSVDNRQVSVRLNENEPEEVFRLNIHQIAELGQLTGALITLENITDEQRMIRANYEQEKSHALNRIIAGIAHEIKNPLMSIRTYASLIGQKIDDEEFQASFSEFVPREADRINNLIESLVSYARPARGQKRRVDICQLVQECAYLSRVAKRRLPIEVVIQADGPAFIEADPDQIKQVIINMVINGIEAMETKMQRFSEVGQELRLSISVERTGNQALLTIADNGIGMTQEERLQCTNLFYTTKNHGTGLGLALSEQFVRENGGWLEIVSKEGEFTRFMIYFPSVSPECERVNP